MQFPITTFLFLDPLYRQYTNTWCTFWYSSSELFTIKRQLILGQHACYCLLTLVNTCKHHSAVLLLCRTRHHVVLLLCWMRRPAVLLLCWTRHLRVLLDLLYSSSTALRATFLFAETVIHESTYFVKRTIQECYGYMGSVTSNLSVLKDAS